MINIFCNSVHAKPEDCYCIPTEVSLPAKKFTPEQLASFVTAVCNRLFRGVDEITYTVRPTVPPPCPPGHVKIEWFYLNKNVAMVKHEPNDNFPWRIDVTTPDGATYSTYNKREEAIDIVSTIVANISRHGLRSWLASNYECL